MNLYKSLLIYNYSLFDFLLFLYGFEYLEEHKLVVFQGELVILVIAAFLVRVILAEGLYLETLLNGEEVIGLVENAVLDVELIGVITVREVFVS